MSVHRSLKISAGLVKHKNVLTKRERIERLRADGKWSDDMTVYGMPKVANRKVVGKKKKKKEE
ncbi:MAG: small basic protein [Planctomycetota bacterium]|nr:MAG: small basic protein [Planctomycetota bacterium]